jgi:hypothetical protein
LAVLKALSVLSVPADRWRGEPVRVMLKRRASRAGRRRCLMVGCSRERCSLRHSRTG